MASSRSHFSIPREPTRSGLTVVIDEALKHAFEEFGEVISASFVVDGVTGRSRGFGFVEYGSVEEAERALATLNGTELDGRQIQVRVAVPGRSRSLAFEAAATQATEVAPTEASSALSSDEATPHRKRVLDLLGGAKVLGATPAYSDEQAHARVLRGIPARAMVELLSGGQVLPEEEVLAALNVSSRSFARRKSSPRSPLPLDEAGRLWRFTEILAQAIEVFGTRAAAEEWLARPALGLAKQRPIELLKTPPGASLVADHLTRLEYGVYA